MMGVKDGKGVGLWLVTEWRAALPPAWAVPEGKGVAGPGRQVGGMMGSV